MADAAHLVEKLRELHARVAHKENTDIENLRQVLAKTLAVLIAEFGHVKEKDVSPS